MGGEGYAYSAAAPRPDRPQYGRALLLFALTFLTTTTLGPIMVQLCRTDMSALSEPWLTPSVVLRIWSHPELLRMGLAFSIPALLILFVHEMGHYVACRLYGIPCTLPFFLPIPLNFGTLGAFIRIKSPIRTKAELFDVGIAGPIAGFLALIPFLLWGIAHSEPARLLLAAPGADDALTPILYLPGRCLAIVLATWLFHGRLGPGMILNLHPVALAAWLGLLCTSLNLLPLGQLDGGHVLYATAGRLQRRLALPLWIALGLMGFLWLGWLVWCVIILVIGLFHPPVWDESVPLDPRRRKLAWIALILLILCFIPTPLSIVPVR